MLFPIPTVLSSATYSTNSTTKKNDPLDVKFVSYSYANATTPYLHGFEMAFFLNKLENQNGIKRWKRSILFGKIVGGENVIDALSRTACLDRGGFTIFVDYRVL